MGKKYRDKPTGVCSGTFHAHLQPKKNNFQSAFCPQNQSGTYKCCCLVAVHVTAAARLVFRCASDSQGPAARKGLLPSRNNLGVGDFIQI